jgi:hypothetical protein
MLKNFLRPNFSPSLGCRPTTWAGESDVTENHKPMTSWSRDLLVKLRVHQRNEKLSAFCANYSFVIVYERAIQ